MTSQAFKDLSIYFESKDYQLIPTDSHTVRMYATNIKDYLYLINIIELSEYYVFDYERYLTYRKLTKEQFLEVGAKKVFLLNLLLVENPDMIYREVNYMPQVEEDFQDIHWIIDTTYNELVIPKKQEKHMLGLEEELTKSISHEKSARFKIHEMNKSPVFAGILSISMIAMFLAMVFIQGAFTEEGYVFLGGIKGYNVFKGMQIWRLLTYYLVHGNPLHLLMNSAMIFYFGSKLERYIKGWEFLAIAFVSSIVAGLFAGLISFMQGTETLTIGASGMIYGLIGGILIYSRLTNEHIAGENNYIVLILFLIGVAYGVSETLVNVALHIGGFIGGIIITPLILWNYRTALVASIDKKD